MNSNGQPWTPSPWWMVRYRIRKINPYPDLINPANGTLFLIMLGCMIYGGMKLYLHDKTGWACLIVGFLMLLGVDSPPTEGTKRVWLVTAFGQMTTIRVYRTSLFFNWKKLNIIGYTEIDLKKFDKDFKLKKPVLCKASIKKKRDGTMEKEDSIYIDDEKSIISAGIFADDTDDDPFIPGWDKTRIPLLGGEKLKMYVNAGSDKGILEHLDDVITGTLESLGKLRTCQWMEKNGQQVALMMLPLLMGAIHSKIKNMDPAHVGSKKIKNKNLSAIDDAQGLGIAFTKFNPILLPAKNIVEARNKVQVNKDERRGQRVVTETINQQIEDRYALYRYGTDTILATPLDEIPPLAEIRKMILEENLMAEGKVTQVNNPRGMNLVQTPQT